MSGAIQFKFDTGNNIINNYSQNNNQLLNYKKGDFITATFSDIKNNMAILKTQDNTAVEVPLSNLAGEIGDELTFEILKNNNEGLSLRQIITHNNAQNFSHQLSKQASQDDLYELLKKHNMINEENVLSTKVQDKNVEEQRKIMQALASIRRQLSYAANSISKNAINELVSSGLSLEKISLNILNSVMQEIEDKPPQEISDEELTKLIGDISEKEIAEKTAFYKKLMSRDMPINEKNIKSLESVKNKLDTISSLEDDTISNILEHELPLTLENIYKSKYSTTKKPDKGPLSDKTWEVLKPAVMTIFNRESIGKTEENISSAKFLIESELPVTKDNINKFKFLKNLKDNLNLDKVLNDAITNLKKGDNVANITLHIDNKKSGNTTELLNNYNKIIDAIPNIKLENIEMLLKKQTPMNLKNLIKETISLDKQVQQKDMSALNEDISVKVVTARRQLAEIQLKLTKEAAMRLAGKDINIDTMPLEEALKTLRTSENESFTKNLNIMGTHPTKENLEKMGSLYDKLAGFNRLTNNVFGDILTRKSEFTVSGIHLSLKAAKTLENLETFATVANPKYGDSFEEVANQFSDLLKKLNIEPTDENLKAASILSRNKIDITLDNIARINTIDSKINRISNTLHPNIAANMIKEGLNPSEMHVDEVLSYINKWNGSLGEDLGDKISKYIMEMDRQNVFDKDTRESMVAIYRMLNSIQKDDSVALGVSLKSGTNITLGSLLESSKYYSRTRHKNTDIDYIIDDQHNINKLKAPENSIRNILQRSYENALNNLKPEQQQIAQNLLNENLMGKTDENIDKVSQIIEEESSSSKLAHFENNLENVKAFTEKAEPNSLGTLITQNPEMNDETLAIALSKLEEIAAEQHATEPNTEKYNDLINNIKNSSPNIINWMNEHQIPLTLNNINIIGNVIKNPFFVSNELNKLESSEEEFDDLLNDIPEIDLESLKNGSTPTEILNKIEEKIDEIKENSYSGKILEQLNFLKSAVKFQNFIHQRDDNEKFQIPVKLHDKIAGLNMYILNDKISSREENKIFMSLNTTNLGNVQIYLNVKDKDASITITSDNENAVSYLEKNVGDLNDLLSKEGANLTNIKFANLPIKNMLEQETVTHFPVKDKKFNSRFEIIV